jgi:hypothetical protein
MMLGYALHFIPKKVDFQIQNLITKVPVYVQALLIAIMIIIVYQAEAAQLQLFIYFNF